MLDWSVTSDLIVWGSFFLAKEMNDWVNQPTSGERALSQLLWDFAYASVGIKWIEKEHCMNEWMKKRTNKERKKIVSVAKGSCLNSAINLRVYFGEVPPPSWACLPTYIMTSFYQENRFYRECEMWELIVVSCSLWWEGCWLSPWSLGGQEYRACVSPGWGHCISLWTGTV